MRSDGPWEIAALVYLCACVGAVIVGTVVPLIQSFADMPNEERERARRVARRLRRYGVGLAVVGLVVLVLV